MANLADIILQANPMAAFGRATNYGQNVGANVQNAMAMKMRQRELQQQQAARQQQIQLAQEAAKRNAQLFPSQLAKSQAASKLQQFKSQHPLLTMPGAAGQYGAANYYTSNFAPGTSEYQLGQNLSEDLKTQQDLAQSTTERNKVLSGTQGLRVLPGPIKDQYARALQHLGYPSTAIADMGTRTANYIINHRIENTEASGYPQKVAKSEEPLTESDQLKKAMTTQQQQQLVTINTALKSWNNLNQQLKDGGFDNYFGFGGQLRFAKDKGAVSAGLPASKSYANYMTFNRFMPTLINEIRRGYGGPGTDQETKLMSSLATPNFMINNPQLFKSQWDELQKMLGKQKSIISKPLAQQLGSPSSEKQVFSDDVPKSWKSQDDFNQWYKNATPQQRKLARSQQGGS